MSLAEDLEDMFAERDKNEHAPENEEIIMKKFPLMGASWYEEIYTMDLGASKKQINNWDALKSNGIVYRRVVMCGRAFKKNKQVWDATDVMAQRAHFQYEFNYALMEDIHQYANYCQIMYKEDPTDVGRKKFFIDSMTKVVLSLVMQIILLYYLGLEVFQKELTPSGKFMTLRIILVMFMVYLFDAEATSIGKTKLFVNSKKVSWFTKYMNILREALAYATIGTAMWQVFSANPYETNEDEATSVVDEIMNFAALLIVIELDDFLMAGPGQLQCKQFYGDQYMTHKFTHAEIQGLAYKGLPIKRYANDSEDVESKLTCCEKITNFVEWIIAVIFKFAVFFVILIVNLQIIETFSVQANILDKLRSNDVISDLPGGDDTAETVVAYSSDYTSELYQYN